jgi:hypothetical protein
MTEGNNTSHPATEDILSQQQEIKKYAVTP